MTSISRSGMPYASKKYRRMKSNEFSNNTWRVRKASPPRPSLVEPLARSKPNVSSGNSQSRNDAKTEVAFTHQPAEEQQGKMSKDGVVITFLKRLFRTSSGEDGLTPVKHGKTDIKHD